MSENYFNKVAQKLLSIKCDVEIQLDDYKEESPGDFDKIEMLVEHIRALDMAIICVQAAANNTCPLPMGAMVRGFHEAFGHPVKSRPCVYDRALNELRVRLLKEEVKELEEALLGRNQPDAGNVLKELCDIQYVLTGAFLALGLANHFPAAAAEVHRSNMSKLGSDGQPIIRDDGKVLKGPHFSPADMSSVLTMGEG